MRILRFIGLFVSIPLLSQVSDEGRFSADFVAGCAPFTIQLTELVPVGTVRQYSYEDPDEFFLDLTYTYTSPGSFFIVQIHNDDASPPKTDTLRVEVLEASPPNFNYYLCDGREILVEVDDPTYDEYEVTFAGTSSSTIGGQGSATYAFNVSDPLSIQIRGIFNGAKDNCATSSLVLSNVIDNLAAPDILSASISQTCENRFALSLLANTEEKALYQIEVDQGGGYQVLYDGSLEDESIFELSPFDQSQTQLDVRINAYNICDDTYRARSPTSVTLNEGQLEPIRNLYSTYQGSDVIISLDPVDVGLFQIGRSFDEVSYSNQATTSGLHTDSTGFLGRQYFYQVSYLDTCGGSWNTKRTSPPFIRSTILEPNKYQIALDPAMFPADESVSYSGKLSGNSNEIFIPISSTSFELMIPPTVGSRPVFIVQGTSDSFEFASNPLTLEYEFVIKVPKAFTPNGDGLNDRLEFFGIDNSQAELKIYTRWGQQVYYEISSAPSWDGRINGTVASDGIYVYEISVPQISNQVQKGTFALLKR